MDSEYFNTARAMSFPDNGPCRMIRDAFSRIFLNDSINAWPEFLSSSRQSGNEIKWIFALNTLASLIAISSFRSGTLYVTGTTILRIFLSPDPSLMVSTGQSVFLAMRSGETALKKGKRDLLPFL